MDRMPTKPIKYRAERPVVIDLIPIYGWHTKWTLAYMRREAHRAHNMEIKWPLQKVNLIFELGELGSTMLARVWDPRSIGPG